MFKLDDIIIDRIQMGIAEKKNGELLYTLTQLSEATIETTAESKEARDANGSLIKKFYQAKSGTFTATNAMLNLNIIGEASGSGKKVGVTEMPKIDVINGENKTVEFVLKGAIVSEGTVPSLQVHKLAYNGTMGEKLTVGDAAVGLEYKVTVEENIAVITLPAIVEDEDGNGYNFVVKYDRIAQNAAKVVNKADEFPGTVKLTLKCLMIDPCAADTLKSCYVIIPSFQVSPELSISLTTEGTLDYTGDLQVDFCSKDKKLYEIVVCDDDVEDAE